MFNLVEIGYIVEGKLKGSEGEDFSIFYPHVYTVALRAIFCGSNDLFLMYMCNIGCVQSFIKKFHDLVGQMMCFRKSAKTGNFPVTALAVFLFWL